MWCVLVLVVTCLISFIESKSIPDNNTAVLISKYAKVAHWGATENGTRPEVVEKRSGQSLWTHRSDVNLVSGQSIKTDKPRVAYHYAVYNKQSKVDDGKVERLPAVGEVILDRYNPRPYFGYTRIPPKSEESATYGVPKPTSPSPSGDSFDSFPAVFNVAPSTSKPVDLYTSPYSSYNPPPPMGDSPPVTDTFPPSGQDSYAAPPADGGYEYPKPPQLHPTPSYASLGPPLSPEYMPADGDDSMMPSDHDHDHRGHNVDAPPSDHMSMYQHEPNYPPKNEDDIYYPPDSSGGNDHHMDQSPKGFMPAPADSMDMAPPDHGQFPQYLYDSHHYDHHVYEEVPHTTTEAAEEKRVSSGHYSYYYLGRKLWYVPLYFSIYFIIYVAVLILKAIARHKVQYKHKWASHTRESRKLNSDENEYLDDVTRNVTSAVDKVKRMYAYAM